MNDRIGPEIVVLAGGISSEREVSLGSGRACAIALARLWPTRLVDVQKASLPRGLNPRRDVVFSTLHGTFGEDGAMQRLLDEAGIFYAGCDAASSALTFAKQETKRLLAERMDCPVPAGIAFEHTAIPSVEVVLAELGERVVVKPNRGGSSVGLAICDGREEITTALSALSPGSWLVEERIMGREFTVGILNGEALPVVEIAPVSGVFDYAAKYTKGLTEYIAPAQIPEELATLMRERAKQAFQICACRDYARIDFMITEKNDPFLLEINTLPGMKETSLLPMGAKSMGMSFTELVGELVSPALARRARTLEKEILA